jgi:hypothetical protein
MAVVIVDFLQCACRARLFAKETYLIKIATVGRSDAAAGLGQSHGLPVN